VMGVLPREVTALPPPSAEGYELPEGMAAEQYALRRLDDLGATQQEKMRQEIARMIEREPDRVVSLLRSWMLEDT
jgi:flagellar biosynthesis/type III secretory pathway M-ring protein FliF/YscJ